MKINKAIRAVMFQKGVTLTAMAKALNVEKGNNISARLNNGNMTFDKAVEMLNVMGYEIVIQERKPGSRRSDQMVIDQCDDTVPTDGE